MRAPGVPFIQGRNEYSDKDGRKYGIAIHNTSNDAPASGEASYATRRTDGISAHFYGDDRDVIQSIDTKYRTGHAGSTEGNENAVSVEITGTNAKSRQWWLDNVAWEKLGLALAAVCREYDIQPRRASVAEMKANPKVRAFYSHDDMRRAWGGTTHTDPGDNFPWDKLFASVKDAMNGEDDMTKDEVKAAFLEALEEKIQLPNPIDDRMARLGASYGPKVSLWVMLSRMFEHIVRESMGLNSGDEVSAEDVASRILSVLTPQRIAAAIPPAQVSAVADELARRLQGGQG